MQRYFFIISFIGSDINESFLIGRCLKILHGFYHHNEIHDIGVSFPQWSNESIGRSLAFISANASSLKFLANQKYFRDMQQLKYFEISQIQVCELTKENSVLFFRNQQLDKITPTAQKRKLKRFLSRAEKRGELYTPKIRQTQLREFELSHKIPMTSKGNQNNYAIHIQKKTFSESNTDKFNSYGLSTNQQIANPVPKNFPSIQASESKSK
ncbi:type I-F CRISPR-associated endoribonuclease Cas6/Csy4 [Catenovulum maritimum]|uniref:type I-F CRISPR-associated endoribonuclease Cas6/Csy4 n=1 Tax=Catenovulum maritimum TaxID=1513271 RepID=UPI000660577F|nr:type I-F CRISPR-associated endoribonuclease Cas6/Csy4 [Catenovulum maritimum]